MVQQSPLLEFHRATNAACFGSTFTALIVREQVSQMDSTGPRECADKTIR